MLSIKGEGLHDFSEQQLVDCTNSEAIGNYGCAGGWLDNTYAEIAKDGLMLEVDYPYHGSDGQCHWNRNKVVGRTEGVSDLKLNNELEMKKAVA